MSVEKIKQTIIDECPDRHIGIYLKSIFEAISDINDEFLIPQGEEEYLEKELNDFLQKIKLDHKYNADDSKSLNNWINDLLDDADKAKQNLIDEIKANSHDKMSSILGIYKLIESEINREAKDKQAKLDRVKNKLSELKEEIAKVSEEYQFENEYK